jgi:hypothetical protein
MPLAVDPELAALLRLAAQAVALALLQDLALLLDPQALPLLPEQALPLPLDTLRARAAERPALLEALTDSSWSTT